MMYDFNLRPIGGGKPAEHPAKAIMAKRWEERRAALKPDADSGSSTAALAASESAPNVPSAIELRSSQKVMLIVALISNSLLLALYFGGFLG